jgi:hypothetical protein
MTQPAELADISWNGFYPGVRVDPSYNIFYNKCKNQNYWRDKLVTMDFSDTNYYAQNKLKSDKLYGLAYPANVTFSCGNINECGVDIEISSIATTDDGGINWNLVADQTIELCQILTIDIGQTLNITDFTLTLIGKIIC